MRSRTPSIATDAKLDWVFAKQLTFHIDCKNRKQLKFVIRPDTRSARHQNRPRPGTMGLGLLRLGSSGGAPSWVNLLDPGHICVGSITGQSGGAGPASGFARNAHCGYHRQKPSRRGVRRTLEGNQFNASQLSSHCHSYKGRPR